MISLEDRIERLELAFLTYISLATGEMQKVTNPEELDRLTTSFGVALVEIKEGLSK